MIILIIYLIGCVLCYGRYYASQASIDKDYINYVEPSDDKIYDSLLFCSLSWFGIFIGIIMYFYNNEHYFLKFSDKDLWKEHYEYKEKIKIVSDWFNESLDLYNEYNNLN